MKQLTTEQVKDIAVELLTDRQLEEFKEQLKMAENHPPIDENLTMTTELSTYQKEWCKMQFDEELKWAEETGGKDGKDHAKMIIDLGKKLGLELKEPTNKPL